MINSIQGRVISSVDSILTLEVGSFQISLWVATAHLYHKDTIVSLQTHLSWSAEHGPQLFGFSQPIERDIFLMVIDCSGIGPKLALSILATFSLSEFIHLVQANDSKSLAKVPGIGAKKAEHLLVHLKHRLEKLLEKNPLGPASLPVQERQTLSQVLGSLQYDKTEIAAALDYVATNPTTSFDAMLRQALTFLAKHKTI